MANWGSLMMGMSLPREMAMGYIASGMERPVAEQQGKLLRRFSLTPN